MAATSELGQLPQLSQVLTQGNGTGAKLPAQQTRNGKSLEKGKNERSRGEAVRGRTKRNMAAFHARATYAPLPLELSYLLPCLTYDRASLKADRVAGNTSRRQASTSYYPLLSLILAAFGIAAILEMASRLRLDGRWSLACISSKSHGTELRKQRPISY